MESWVEGQTDHAVFGVLSRGGWETLTMKAAIKATWISRTLIVSQADLVHAKEAQTKQQAETKLISSIWPVRKPGFWVLLAILNHHGRWTSDCMFPGEVWSVLAGR